MVSAVSSLASRGWVFSEKVMKSDEKWLSVPSPNALPYRLAGVFEMANYEPRIVGVRHAPVFTNRD